MEIQIRCYVRRATTCVHKTGERWALGARVPWCDASLMKTFACEGDPLVIRIMLDDDVFKT